MIVSHPNCDPFGHYTITATAKVLGVDKATISRWVNGHKWNYKGEERFTAPRLKMYRGRYGSSWILGKDINRLWEQG